VEGGRRSRNANLGALELGIDQESPVYVRAMLYSVCSRIASSPGTPIDRPWMQYSNSERWSVADPAGFEESEEAIVSRAK